MAKTLCIGIGLNNPQAEIVLLALLKDSEFLPERLAADEKHTRIKGEKAYVATTVGDQCILGASVAEDAGEESLKKAYGVFQR